MSSNGGSGRTFFSFFLPRRKGGSIFEKEYMFGTCPTPATLTHLPVDALSTMGTGPLVRIAFLCYKPLMRKIETPIPGFGHYNKTKDHYWIMISSGLNYF